MKYLDYSKLAAFRARCFPDEAAADYVSVRRFFGTDRLNPAEVSINHRADRFVLTDPVIDRFAQEVAERMRSEGRIYDGPLVTKLVACDLVSSSPSITVQPVDYALQAGTCFALDLEHPLFADSGGTLRDYYRHECSTPTIDNNPLAICLGVSGCLVIEERGETFMLAVKRSTHLASLEGTIGPSVAGVVDYSTAYANLAGLNDTALGVEIEEELNLKRDEFEIVPLAWGIELFRGERPQLFSLVRTSLDRESMRSRLLSIPNSYREFESFEFVPLGNTSWCRPALGPFNFEAHMNAELVREYLRR